MSNGFFSSSTSAPIPLSQIQMDRITAIDHTKGDHVKPQRINWKVAAVVGATTSMVGAGGFALADEVADTNDSEPTSTTTQSVSIEPARPSAPVVVESDANVIDDSVESVPSAESVAAEVPTGLADQAPSAESIPSVEATPPAPAEPAPSEPISVESVSAPSVSAPSVSAESVSAPSVSAESVSAPSVSAPSVSAPSVSAESVASSD